MQFCSSFLTVYRLVVLKIVCWECELVLSSHVVKAKSQRPGTWRPRQHGLSSGNP